MTDLPVSSESRSGSLTALLRSMKKTKSKSFHRINKRHVVINELHLCKGVIHKVQIRTGFRRVFVQKWATRFRKTGTVEDSSRSGRPKLLNHRQVASAVQAVKQFDSVPAAVASLKQKGILPRSISNKTVSRAIKQFLKQKPPRIRPVLTDRTKTKRLAFCRRPHEVETLVAVDSTIIRIGGSGSRHKVWWDIGIPCIQQKVRKGQQLHVYAGITCYGATPLIPVTGTTGMVSRFTKPRGVEKHRGVCAREFQQVLSRHLLPEAKKLLRGNVKGEPVFLLDGAPPHTATSTLNFMRRRKILYLKGWPPNSPDLNPIENLWAWLKSKTKQQDPQTAAALWHVAEQVWETVDADMCSSYVRSFGRRKRACIRKGGDHTGY